jgi:Helix-turn-helix domain
MATSDGYGQRLGERLRVESAPAIVVRASRKADIAVTEIRCDDPLPGMTGSSDFLHHEYWEDGRRRGASRCGATPIVRRNAREKCEVAKEKLRDRRLSLSDVALACGFADQSHLTRVFTGVVGVNPGVWRRALGE